MNEAKRIQPLSILFSIVGLLFFNFRAEVPLLAETLHADTILTNGAVYTVDAKRSWAEAIAISHGKIVFVGKNSEVGKFKAPRTRVIDLKGKMVLPGFIDSHVHLLEGGVETGQCVLNNLKTREEIFRKIREYAAKHPGKPWIVGGGWELPIFPGGNPCKEDLDAIIPDRPAVFGAADGHSAWANSKAFQIAGVTEKTPDPKDGRVERKSGSKEPSGTLRENAMDLVYEVMPKTTQKEMRQGLRTGISLATRAGITSVVDARTDEDYLKVYTRLDRQGELKMNVWASLPVDTEKGPEQIGKLAELRQKYRTDHFKVTSAKIFADGVIEAHTAALLAPYSDRPGDCGKPILEAPHFNNLAIALEKAGFQIHVHAIGDRAIRLTLDAIEAARRVSKNQRVLHQIVHLELIDPADIPRFKELGVVADFQALWAFADPYIKELVEPVLGPERSGRLYPIGSVLKTGAIVAGGSDWTVSSINPLEAIQVAVTRKDPNNPKEQTWLPGELIDLPSAIAAYTINGAILNHQEDRLGSIEPGKSADLVVLSKNIFEIPKEEIYTAKVLMTIFEGKTVFSTP